LREKKKKKKKKGVLKKNTKKKKGGGGCIKLVNQKPLVFHDNLDIKDFIMYYGCIKHPHFQQNFIYIN
jgi:hypothetical protein